MGKKAIYLIAIIAMLIVIVIIWSPKPLLEVPAASPANGLMNGKNPAKLETPPSQPIAPAAVATPPVAAPATATAPTSQVVPQAPAPTAATAPANQAVQPAVAQPPKAMDADDVPAGVDVAPAPTPSVPTPADNKGMVIPPSEGQ